MAERRSPPTQRAGRINDARGRRVTQLDPVKLHLLNQRSIIPAEALRSMADQILPGARRQRFFQVSLPKTHSALRHKDLRVSPFRRWPGTIPPHITRTERPRWAS